jgi:2-polyprenyl-3-methyl-5-hydroxy-6-metoxy-1,4-benzoquinol methylase
MKVISPVVSGGEVTFVRKISTAKIIELYNVLGVSVDKFFQGLDFVEVYRCVESGLEFYSPNTIAGDAQFYESLDKVAPNYYSRWKWEHETLINYLRPDDAVLEIGAAYGTFLKECMNRGASVAVGLELNQNAVIGAQANGIDMRGEFVENHAKENAGRYDLVTTFQVVEHIGNIISFMEASISCLKSNGLLAISVPNNDCYFFKNDPYHTLNLPPHHMGLWREESLRELGRIFNLQIVAVHKQPASYQNFGMYYSVFLQKYLGLQKEKLALVYKFTKSIAKIGMLLSPPKYGACITIVMRKK